MIYRPVYVQPSGVETGNLIRSYPQVGDVDAYRMKNRLIHRAHRATQERIRIDLIRQQFRDHEKFEGIHRG